MRRVVGILYMTLNYKLASAAFREQKLFCSAAKKQHTHIRRAIAEGQLLVNPVYK